ncbi:MAG: cupredoxin domain-containing protein [Actinobacteria bacterium]|nr:cupredoxin domain-containing protein [Actinomycetota bacterium]
MAACAGGDGGDAGDDGPEGTELHVTAREFAFEPSSLSASAGEITVQLENAGATEHDFTVDEANFTALAKAAESASGTLTLEAGTYAFYCSIPGHRESGMEGTLTVS